MIVNAQTITGLFQNMNVGWMQGFETYTPIYSSVTTVKKSITRTETYSWLSRFPRLREMGAEKMIKSMRAYQYSVTNKNYEASIAVSKDDIEDDLFLGLLEAAQGMGLSAAQWYDDLVMKQAFDGMFTTFCCDDQYFVNEDHPLYMSDGTIITYSNKLTKKLSAASRAAAVASLGAAIAMHEGFVDEEGAPFGGDLQYELYVSPLYKDAAMSLMNDEFLTSTEKNPYRGQIKAVKVNRWQTNKEVWALCNVGNILKPFLLQEREAPHFVYVDGQNGEQVSERMFMKREYLFGSEGRGMFGYTLPQLIVASDGSVA